MATGPCLRQLIFRRYVQEMEIVQQRALSESMLDGCLLKE